MSEPTGERAILIRNVGFENKGALLMLRAIRSRLSRWPGSYPLAVNLNSASYAAVRAQGLLLHCWRNSRKLPWIGAVLHQVASTVPRPIRRGLGLSIYPETYAVIDASGFAYGDQWGHHNAEWLLESIRRLPAEARGRVVLLPQAFGPFSSARLRAAMSEALRRSTLAFARDETSRRHLEEAASGGARIEVCPDMTLAVEAPAIEMGELGPYGGRLGGIVPNFKVFDKLPSVSRDDYLRFLREAALALQHMSLQPVFIIHAGRRDLALAEEVCALPDVDGHIIHHDDPLTLKAWLGACQVVVGSRFHGLLGALSQGVPCLGVGWSHKYQELFRDFACERYLIGVEEGPEQAKELLAEMLDGEARSEISRRLLDRAREMKESVENMWRQVEAALLAP